MGDFRNPGHRRGWPERTGGCSVDVTDGCKIVQHISGLRQRLRIAVMVGVQPVSNIGSAVIPHLGYFHRLLIDTVFNRPAVVVGIRHARGEGTGPEIAVIVKD